MTTTLTTWACGHFCIRHSAPYQSEKATLRAACDDFWFLADTADEDLSDMVTDQHIASCENCPKCQEPVSVSFWLARADEGIRELRHNYAGVKRIYLENGAKYITLDFSQKARYAHDDRCAAAHEQFWISKTPRHQDPFFASMEKILRLCDQADAILEDSETHADVKEAFVHINNARAEVGRLIAPLDDLMSGVRLISEVGSRYKDFEYDTKTQLMSRESMVSGFKGPSWCNRMEDWTNEAIAALLKASGTSGQTPNFLSAPKHEKCTSYSQRTVRKDPIQAKTMQPSAGYEFEAVLRPELEGLKLFFSGLNNQIAKLDQEYKKHGIYYHSIHPDLRDEHYGDYEQGPNNELPETVKLVRGLDMTARNASVMLRRNDVTNVAPLHRLQENASERLEETKRSVTLLGDSLVHLSLWGPKVEESDRILAQGPLSLSDHALMYVCNISALTSRVRPSVLWLLVIVNLKRHLPSVPLLAKVPPRDAGHPVCLDTSIEIRLRLLTTVDMVLKHSLSYCPTLSVPNGLFVRRPNTRCVL